MKHNMVGHWFRVQTFKVYSSTPFICMQLVTKVLKQHMKWGKTEMQTDKNRTTWCEKDLHGFPCHLSFQVLEKYTEHCNVYSSSMGKDTHLPHSCFSRAYKEKLTINWHF